MGRLHTFVVTLRRERRDINWGLRLVGGADLATPLIVTRVTSGTPAGRELARGDIIAKIDDYDARDLRHEDAQNLFKNASNQIKLVVQRGRPSTQLYSMPRSSGSFIGRSPTPSFYDRFEDAEREGPRDSTLAPRSPIVNASAPPFRTPSPLPSAWRGPESLPRSTPVPPYTQFPVQHEGEFRTVTLSPPSSRNDDVIDESIQSQYDTSALTGATKMAVNPNFFPNGYQDPMHPEEEVVTNWPYRTTPLVLPGAKVRREPGPTESYLRHHPNPAMRAPPHHDYRDTLMKQKFVHKQFNSPINLYSEQNIANSIRQQTTPLPSNGHYGRPHVVKRQVHKPPVQYDPAKSETYRALQEQSGGVALEAEPAHTKLFTAPDKRSTPTPKATKQHEVNSKGKQTTFVNSLHEEHIQQSNSFKRLMYNVLGDTEF
ncbi:unnamed protein product [Parnassius apollo]|uniref:(apollo) hypothetical protein n=1 Tax=Parnassius apollo TaxID=110799 RepID=A0A8S3XJ59_PARAO|nr:unnamed protein product [Parnassius apollo]